MGAGYSVLADNLDVEQHPYPDEIVELVHKIRVFKKSIASSDSNLVIQEVAKKFQKDSRMIILALTSRTKRQLQAMYTVCNFSNPNEVLNLGTGGFGKTNIPLIALCDIEVELLIQRKYH